MVTLDFPRNHPCPCGSGKRYKHCCGEKASGETSATGRNAPPDSNSTTKNHESAGIECYRHLLGARHATFRFAFDEFIRNQGRVVVELGTSRSFVSGGHPGCMVNDMRYWQPSRPELWDWGAGLFTRMCAEELGRFAPEIHTVDISRDALEISRVITFPYREHIRYHLMSSEQFLSSFQGRIDLLYMDAGETGQGAEELHLREARIVIERQLLSPAAVILVDDVNVPGIDESKGTLSIPYLKQHGFEVRHWDYQVALQRPA